MSKSNIDPFLEIKRLKKIVSTLPEDDSAFLKDIYLRLHVAEQENEYVNKLLEKKKEEITGLNARIKQLTGMVKVT